VNLCQLVTEAERRFRDTAGSVIDGEGWCHYINTAMRELQGLTPFWPWLEAAPTTISLVAGQTSADLPTNTYTVNWAYNVTLNAPMYPDEGRGSQWHGARQLIDTTGNPRTYKVRGAPGTGEAATSTGHGCIDFYPIPDASYTVKIEGMSYNPRLDATVNCIPPFPEIFHDVLVEGAMSLAYLDDDNMQQHKAHQDLFVQGIQELQWAMLNARNETNAPIRDTFFL
jgi:hypothetical protein